MGRVKFRVRGRVTGRVRVRGRVRGSVRGRVRVRGRFRGRVRSSVRGRGRVLGVTTEMSLFLNLPPFCLFPRLSLRKVSPTKMSLFLSLFI